MDFDDDIMSSFIEDTREHLTGIEASLMDLEQAGAEADQELVNTVFRAAHSIKGGASFLGLDNVRDLAHKLENVLHMVRNGEIVPDNAVVSPLLQGFDLLRTLVDDVQTSNARDISGAIRDLSDLATGHLPPASRERLAQGVDIALPGGGSAMTLDLLSLEQALQGGKYLYLVEYDLIHDVHARGKTPLDIISAMESTGLILDCRMDLAAVGDLDDPPGNRLPFFLLYATIVEPDVVGYLFALDASRIRVMDRQALLAGAGGSDGPPAAVAPFPVEHSPEPSETGTPFPMELTGGLDTDSLARLKPELLAAMKDHQAVSLDLGGASEVNAAFVQFFCAAHRSFAAKGKALLLAGTGPDLGERLAWLGLSPEGAAGCGLSALLAASEGGRS